MWEDQSHHNKLLKLYPHVLFNVAILGRRGHILP